MNKWTFDRHYWFHQERYVMSKLTLNYAHSDDSTEKGMMM